MFSLMKSNGQRSGTVAEIADEVWKRCASEQSGLTGDVNPVSVLALETAVVRRRSRRHGTEWKGFRRGASCAPR
jgi:hypothetical protein